MNRNRILQITVLILAFTQVSIGAPPLQEFFGGMVGDLSDKYANSFTPAGYVFSIWGPIYFSFIALAIFQLLPGKRDDALLKPLRLPLSLAAFFSTIWIPIFLQEWLFVAMLVLFGLAGSLLWAYRNVVEAPRELSRLEWWIVRAPIALYFGWGTIAAVANTTVFLVGTGWDGFGIPAGTWAAALVIVATIIVSFVVAYGKGDPVYGGVAIWAFIGIALKESGITTVTAFSMAALVLVWIVYLNWRGSETQLIPARQA